MGRIELNNHLKAIQAQNKKMFIPYIMAGDGGLDQLEDQLLFLQACGATAIEVGIPFSDPVADGPTIQNAGKRALNQQTTLQDVLTTLQTFKNKRNIPVIVMTYMNPIYAYGVERFAYTCATSGVDGVIIPDVPLEEDQIIMHALKRHDIALIRLLALTSSKERMKAIIERAEGFIYAVTVNGTTGVREHLHPSVKEYLQKLKQQSAIPVLAGFGVSSSEQAKELSAYCDGVIVGSKIVQLLHEGKQSVIRQLTENTISQSMKIT
ncbi:tryptophan synthase subunit alpha [Virgibacillus dokdonensis]|uniref:Tryptophan synthase alpha chain n=1 Tax=Virgibacillus dokdonensis TaxID=302167 RepID=A0A3E0WJE2_9BACI|nr:tryptophan synthase subunit alpha [Virgibacillus dokdonensis]RFA31985.1 tryptophan synthase subunit alpha [Virgibacillus dokdonensis]